jgi:predicted N-formylglutamate amidohydrolase
MLNVDGNGPYTVSRDDDYAIPVHGQDRGHEAILVEIRQDLVSTPQGIAEWTDRLAKALLGQSHQE